MFFILSIIAFPQSNFYPFQTFLIHHLFTTSAFLGITPHLLILNLLQSLPLCPFLGSGGGGGGGGEVGVLCKATQHMHQAAS